MPTAKRTLPNVYAHDNWTFGRGVGEALWIPPRFGPVIVRDSSFTAISDEQRARGVQFEDVSINVKPRRANLGAQAQPE